VKLSENGEEMRKIEGVRRGELERESGVRERVRREVEDEV